MSSRFSDAERAAILAEARRSTEELKDFRPREPVFVSEDPMVKWRREAEESEQRKAAWKTELRRRERQTVRAMQDQQADSDRDWNDWLRRALDSEREVVLDYIGRLLTEVVGQMREETAAEIKKALAENNRKQKRGEIIDPAPPLRRRVHVVT
jgi:hypothetical protein